jgi:hypothetical protein
MEITQKAVPRMALVIDSVRRGGGRPRGQEMRRDAFRVNWQVEKTRRITGRATAMRWFGKKQLPSLDEPLFQWSPRDVVSVRMLLNSVAVFGRTGSGKTSYSGRQIGRAIVRNKKSGGLIHSAKPEDRRMWEAIFREAVRPDDLLIFGPGEPLRFNFLDYEMRHGGHTRNITKVITTIGESLRASDVKGSENADFWEREQEREIYNAVEVVKLATGRVSAPDLQRFISGAANSPEMIAAETWRSGFHNQCIARAFESDKSPIERHDFELALDYWLNEYPNMADKTRSSISTGVMGILHTFNTGIVRELVSSDTNASPDDILAGKWILIDASPSEYGDIGAFINAGWKYLTQRAVLRRHVESSDPFVVIWCDEAHQFVNSHDAHYLAQSRSHRGCTVFLTQSVHSLYAALKGQAGKHQADALLSNFGTKVVHAVGDAQSAEFAAGLVGRKLETFIGGSSTPVEDLWDEMVGRTRFTGSFSEQYEYVVQPNVFMNGLRTGGPSGASDAIVIRSGERFSNGQNHLFVTFTL